MALLKRSSNSRHTRNKSDLVRQWSDAFAARIIQALSEAFPMYRVVLFSDRDEALMMCHECQIRSVSEADVLIGSTFFSPLLNLSSLFINIRALLWIDVSRCPWSGSEQHALHAADQCGGGAGPLWQRRQVSVGGRAVQPPRRGDGSQLHDPPPALQRVQVAHQGHDLRVQHHQIRHSHTVVFEIY